MGPLLFFVLLFLLLSAFFSGSEIAFISANKIRIELLKEQGRLRGKILSGFYEKPRQFAPSRTVKSKRPADKPRKILSDSIRIWPL